MNVMRMHYTKTICSFWLISVHFYARTNDRNKNNNKKKMCKRDQDEKTIICSESKNYSGLICLTLSAPCVSVTLRTVLFTNVQLQLHIVGVWVTQPTNEECAESWKKKHTSTHYYNGQKCLVIVTDRKKNACFFSRSLFSIDNGCNLLWVNLHETNICSSDPSLNIGYITHCFSTRFRSGTYFHFTSIRVFVILSKKKKTNFHKA